MADKSKSRSPGSLPLQALIVVIIGILILSVMYPKSLWQDFAERENISRQRMANLFYAEKFFHSRNARHTADINEIISFAMSDSITVNPPGFKMDRLTREDSGVDSFIVEYYDPYGLFRHYSDSLKVTFLTPAKDSIALDIVPLPRYPFVPVTRFTFAADQEIRVRTEFKGNQGVVTFVGSKGRLRGTQILGEPIRVPAYQYIFNMDPKDIGTCPSTGLPYKMVVNVKMGIESEMKAMISKTAVTENALSSSPLFASIVTFRMIKEADAEASKIISETQVLERVEDSLLTFRSNLFYDSVAAVLTSKGKTELAALLRDSTLDGKGITDTTFIKEWDALRDSTYAFMNLVKESPAFTTVRDSIVNARKEIILTNLFGNVLAKMKKDGRVGVSENGSINTIADSVTYYSETERIKEKLLKPHADSVTNNFLKRQDVQELFALFQFTEAYRVTGVDATGVTISSPIEGEYINPNPSFLERIYSVGGEKNHGKIVNGDMSWVVRK